MAEFNFPNRVFSYTEGGSGCENCEEGMYLKPVYFPKPGGGTTTETPAGYEPTILVGQLHQPPYHPIRTPSTNITTLKCRQCVNGECKDMAAAHCVPPLKPGAPLNDFTKGWISPGPGRQPNMERWIIWPSGTGPNTHFYDRTYMSCPKFGPDGKQIPGTTSPCPLLPKPSGPRTRTVSSRSISVKPQNGPTFIHNSIISGDLEVNQKTFTSTTQADIDNTFGATDPNSVASVSYTSQPQSLEYSSDTLDSGTINSLAQSVDPGVLDSIIDHVAKNLCENGGTYSSPPCGSGETFVISTGSCEPTNNVQVDTNGWPKDTLNNVVSRIDSRVQLKRKNKLLDILQSNNSINQITDIANAAEYVAITNDSLTQTQRELVLQGVAELHSIWDDPNYATAEDHLAAVIKSMNKVKDNVGNTEIVNLLNAISSSFTDVYTELLVDCESNTYPDSVSVSVALALNEPYLLESVPLTLTMTSSDGASAYTRFRRPKPSCTPPKVFDFATSKCVCPDGYYNCDNTYYGLGNFYREADCIKCLPPKIIFNEDGRCGCKCPEGQVECAKTGGCMPECKEGLQRSSRAPCGECVCVQRGGIGIVPGGSLLPVLGPILGPIIPGAGMMGGIIGGIIGGRPQIINDADCNSKIPGSIVKKNSGGCYCDCPDGKVAQQCKYVIEDGILTTSWESDPYFGFRCTDPCYAPHVWNPDDCECACPSGADNGCYYPYSWDDYTCECVCPSGVDCEGGSGVCPSGECYLPYYWDYDMCECVCPSGVDCEGGSGGW